MGCFAAKEHHCREVSRLSSEVGCRKAVVPALCLPSRPNLEHRKGQARALQRQIRAGDKALLEIVGRPSAAIS